MQLIVVTMKTAVHTVLVGRHVFVCNKFKRSTNVFFVNKYPGFSLLSLAFSVELNVLQGSFTHDVGKGRGLKSKIVFLVITTSVTGFTVGFTTRRDLNSRKSLGDRPRTRDLVVRDTNTDSVVIFFLCLKLNIIKK